ncbi:MAG: cytotoxin [candidate division NC10 bacterium]|nr:cytotoxin [candidate division NC10 bacterium]
MRPHFSERFIRSYETAPLHIQRAFDRKLDLLVANLRHPSLRAKKYDETRGIWQARVDGGWRFYFRVEGDVYQILDLVPHPK